MPAHRLDHRGEQRSARHVGKDRRCRRASDPAAAPERDGSVQHVPEPWLRRCVQVDGAVHSRTSIGVHLEVGPDGRCPNDLSPVEGELQPSRGTSISRLQNLVRDRCLRSVGEAAITHRDDVDIALVRDEAAERNRADKVCADEPGSEIRLQSSRDVIAEAGDVFGHHGVNCGA